jgi:hypothetical protein
LRREIFLGAGEISWIETGEVLKYKRGNIEVILNTSNTEYPINGKVLLASHQITNTLPPKSAAWIAI